MILAPLWERMWFAITFDLFLMNPHRYTYQKLILAVTVNSTPSQNHHNIVKEIIIWNSITTSPGMVIEWFDCSLGVRQSDCSSSTLSIHLFLPVVAPYNIELSFSLFVHFASFESFQLYGIHFNFFSYEITMQHFIT